ncbi:MAG: ribonuclease HI family protein [Patescibacteria group bacterium]|nr:ribonuclease HI family protein [Patescibacteria group bacterium]
MINQQAKNLIINTDGGSRGNPGPAAIGVVIKNNSNKIIHQFGQTIGIATNNVAEYQGVIFALKYLIKNKLTPTSIKFYLDSTLVVNQLGGLWKVKNPNLRNLVIKIRELEATLNTSITYAAIPREKNYQPDALLNQALDS